MHKVIAFTITIAVVYLMCNTAVSANAKTEISPETAEQVLLRLLFHPAYDAIEDYYGEPRQYWKDSILSIREVPDSPYYEVVMKAETFYGPHNPPYGIEIMTFYVSYGNVELKSFEHKDDPN
jgi:hypothetical protein